MDGQYYFVKAISQEEIQNGSMTGTVKSLKVYPDGTIEEN
jgi:dihydroorotase